MVDWMAAQEAYITGSASCRELAEQFGLPPSAVAKRCAKEGWREQRMNWRAITVERAAEAISIREAGQLASVTRAAERLTSMVEALMADQEQFYKYIVPRSEVYDPPADDGQGHQVKQRKWSEVQVLSRADTRAIREAAGALKSLTATLRDLYELPTQAQAHRQRMDERRMELLESRAEGGEALMIALDPAAEELAL